MSEVSLGEIAFHPTSFCDGNGRLFWWKGELFRGIPEKGAVFTRRLFADGTVAELARKKFIPPTELTAHALPGYPVVLHHARLPFVAYSYEWSPMMLRDAGLFVIRYLRELAGHGLTLGGAASWNVLFAGCAPRAVDFCDIMEAPPNREALWAARLEPDFRGYYLRPLELYTRGQGNLARLLLTDYEHGPIQDQFAAATAPVERVRSAMTKAWRRGARSLRRRVQGEGGAEWLQARLQECETRLAAFHFPTRPSPPALPADERTFLRNAVAQASPRTALAIGADDATIALLVESGAAVVAIDRDERRVDGIYQQALKENANVLSLIVDLRYPAPGYGVQNAVLAPALTRLRCDLVVALQLLGSLVFAQRLRFEQIAGTLADLTLRTLVVDFPSAQNAAVLAHADDPYFDWFSCERFLDALRPHFDSVRSEAAPANGGDTVILCEKGPR